MAQDSTPEFGKWRARLWPVHGHELKKVVPLFLMFFFISFNYTVFRDTKDALVVTSPAGAMAIPFLKVYGVVPAAILIMLIYTKLSNVLSKTGLFYATLAPFIVFAAIFPTVLYPNGPAIQLDGTADFLGKVLPAGWSGLVESIRYWHFSLFYIIAEMWGSVVLSLLFWGFANEIMKITEAKRFYTILGLGANVALLFSGPMIVWASRVRDGFAEGMEFEAWGYSLNLLMAMVIVSAVCVAGIYWYINNSVLTDPRYYDPSQVKKKKSKPKMSMGESMRYLLSSKYIGCIALLVIAYGISINLVEVVWKSNLKQQYGTGNAYSEFMGMFSTCMGAATIFMLLFVGGNAIRYSWKFAALITPVMLGITGTLFFGFAIFKDSQFLAGMVASLGTTPLFLAVIFGAAQNILSKSAKYSLFDPTKEVAYIPLDSEVKMKGKAAVDVVAARLGKSGGSLAFQILFAFGTIASVTPIVAGILLLVIVMWLWAVGNLDRQFQAVTAQQQSETPETPEVKPAATGEARPATA